MLFLAFFKISASGFFGCFANPRAAFGFKRRGVFHPSLTRGYNIGRSYRS